MSRWAGSVAEVAATEDGLRRVRLAGERAVALTVARPVAGDLGTVRVGGSGQLLDIELDVRRLRRTDAAALGPRLLRAIRDAEDEARELRREILAEAEVSFAPISR
jgi:hypothetical protein